MGIAMFRVDGTEDGGTPHEKRRGERFRGRQHPDGERSLIGLSDRATGYIFGASLGFKKQHLVSHIIGFFIAKTPGRVISSDS